MAMFSLGINTTVSGSAAANSELRTVSGVPYRARYIAITLAAATASTYGIGRPAAIGITPTSPIQMLPLNPNDLATNAPSTAVAWGTGPTVPTNFLERITLPATIGAGVIWNYGPNEFLLMPVNAAAGVASIVVWNIAASSASTNITFRGEI